MRTVPEICRVTNSRPGEIFQIYGENLENCRVFGWQPPDNREEDILSGRVFEKAPPLPDRPKNAIEMKVEKRTSQVLYVRMPLPMDEAYNRLWQEGCKIIWVVGPDGEVPAVINRPIIWNQSLVEALPGDRIALFGQNLFQFDQEYDPGICGLLQNIDTGKVYRMAWGSCQDLQQYMPRQNEHKSEYILPKDLPAGEYRMTMSNGTGGRWGWAEPLFLTVRDSRTLTEYCRFRWSYDCRQTPLFDMSEVPVERIPAHWGDGLADATDTIQDAIDRIHRQGGGLVLFPAGRFGLTRTLEIKPGVILRGAGMGATTLSVADGRALPNTGLPENLTYAYRPDQAKHWAIDFKKYLAQDNNTALLWLQTDSGLEDLKVEGGSGAVVLVAVGTADGSVSRGVFLNQVEVDNAVNAPLFMGGAYSMAYHGVLTTSHTEDFTMYKCRVRAAYTLMLLPGHNRRVRLIGNDFEVSPHQTGDNVFLGGSYNGMITENIFRYGRRTLVSQQGFFNNWVFQNRSEGVANTTNANEEYMSEFGFSAWAGTPSAVDASSITAVSGLETKPLSHGGGCLRDNLGDYPWMLTILHGRGFGQYRHVIRVEDGKLYLDRPWDILPDENTFFNLHTGSEHNLWVDNYAGNGSGISQFVYLAGLENIVAGHQCLVSSGIAMYAQEAEMDAEGNITDMGVIAFNQFLGCDLRYSGMGFCFWTHQSWTNLEDLPIPHVNVLGNLIRLNVMTSGTDAEYAKNQANWVPFELPSGIQMMGSYNLIEKNLIAGYDVGIHLRTPSKGNLLADNRCRHDGRNVLDEGEDNTVIEHVTAYAKNDRGGWAWYDALL